MNKINKFTILFLFFVCFFFFCNIQKHFEDDEKQIEVEFTRVNERVNYNRIFVKNITKKNP